MIASAECSSCINSDKDLFLPNAPEQYTATAPTIPNFQNVIVIPLVALKSWVSPTLDHLFDITFSCRDRLLQY